MRLLTTKLRRRGGFSLTEMLAAMLVLAILTAMGTVGLNTALKERDASIRLSGAQMLSSDVIEILSNELRYGQNIRPGTNSVTLNSASYGENAVIAVDSDGRLTVKVGGTTEYRPLSDASYICLQPEGGLAPGAHYVLKLTELGIGFDEVNKPTYAEISFKVADKDSGTVLWETESPVTVGLLNRQ